MWSRSCPSRQISALEKWADKDVLSAQGCATLMGASSIGHDEVVSLPLRAGAKIAVDIGDHTALMFASGSGHVKVVPKP